MKALEWSEVPGLARTSRKRGVASMEEVAVTRSLEEVARSLAPLSSTDCRGVGEPWESAGGSRREGAPALVCITWPAIIGGKEYIRISPTVSGLTAATIREAVRKLQNT